MSSAGTTHGTGYFYDERVPVLLFGAGIKPGTYWEPKARGPRADATPPSRYPMARPDGRVLSKRSLRLPGQPAPTSAQR